ncbi:MAG: uridine kinase [Candidatus Bathyarchaeota archaeon]|nr:uridine kinase [Candidatus Bathyarchaeota archaeon]
MKRSELLQHLAEEIQAIECSRPLLVAVDGRDAAGKTILAHELAEKLTGMGHDVIEASIDGFHNPREIRYRKGRDDPEGYYRDSFDLVSLKKHLLVPLKVGCMHYQTQVFDYRTDQVIDVPKKRAQSDSILVFDGVFTHRCELRCYWNYSVYLSVSEAESLRRGVERDPGDADEIKRKYQVRYLPGQRLYHTESEPMKHASIIVDNTDPDNPVILGESK